MGFRKQLLQSNCQPEDKNQALEELSKGLERRPPKEYISQTPASSRRPTLGHHMVVILPFYQPKLGVEKLTFVQQLLQMSQAELKEYTGNIYCAATIPATG
jgi:hypothetical protein